MISAEAFKISLEEQGVLLYQEEGKIRLCGPQMLTSEVRFLLGKYREELLLILPSVPPKEYLERNMDSVIHGDALDVLKLIPEGSIDGLITDPPYGFGFMNKEWDRAASQEIWRESWRVLKPGSFIFVFSSPRQDLLLCAMENLREAAFSIGFTSLYWTYTSGFPKAAKVVEGGYAGFQPKPAVEAILVAMKPLSQETYARQLAVNGKGITWLDDCKMPYGKKGGNSEGRFPANLIVSDSTLGEHSKYFNLDRWHEVFKNRLPEEARKQYPFLVVPKSSKGEKEAGLEKLEMVQVGDGRKKVNDTPFLRDSAFRRNSNPCVKPMKLMEYLTVMCSRKGDIILDPFAGSGTTCIAAKLLGRRFIGIEQDKEYFEIAKARVEHADVALKVNRKDAA